MNAVARKNHEYLEPALTRYSSRPNLTVVSGGKSIPFSALKLPMRIGSPMMFVTVCGLILIFTLATVLILNTFVVNRSYEMARLQTKFQVVNQDVQTKQEQLRRAQAELPARAAALGMVPVDTPEIIDATKYAAEIANQMLGAAGPRG